MMRCCAVIDTNVIVSALLRRGSIPDQVLQKTLDGQIVPLISEDILNEYVEVLSREKFHFEKETIEALLADLKDKGIIQDRVTTEEFFADPSDIVFYEVTLGARKAKSAYLITGNRKHFPPVDFVVTPRQMLEIIDRGEGA